jgi:hypothetical protein
LICGRYVLRLKGKRAVCYQTATFLQRGWY